MEAKDKSTLYWTAGVVGLIVVVVLLGYYVFGWFGTVPGQT